MLYVARGGALSLLGQGAGVIVSLVLAVIINHFVTKEAYGEYKFVLSLVGILAMFSLNGIPSAVFQAAAQGYDGALIRGFWANIKWSALVFLGALGLGSYYLYMGNVPLAMEILIGGSLSPFLASGNLYGPFLGGKKDFYRQTLYGILCNITPMIVFIGVILLTSNPVVLVATYFITNLAAALFFYFRTAEIYHASMHRHDADLLSYSKHLSIMGIVSGIAGSLDQILLFHYLGAAQLAVYNFATAIPDQMKGPNKNISSMMQAQFAIRSNKEISSSATNKFLWLLAFCSVITASYIILAPFIFRLLFPNYIEGVWYSQLFSLFILTIPFDVYSTFLVARKLTKELYTLYSLYSIVQIASVLIGVLFWGILGVVLSRVVTKFLIGIVGYVLYKKAISSGASDVAIVG